MATVPRTPDAELLRRLRVRDRDAWEELYAEYQPRLRGYAYRLAGNVHDADDLVQETFVRAVPKLDRLDPETADVASYLFTTLRNLFLKQIERERRQRPVAEVPEPALPTPIEDDPERSTLLRRQQDEVRVANGRLQPRQRLVLALRELEDRSYAEIGELVGMRENAVAQLIFRARESLRTELRLLQVDPERLPEECRRFLPLLAAHLDGQLKGARRDETLAHLGECERCQAALADMREASRRWRALLLPPLESDEARAAIDARLTSAGYWDPSRRGLLARRTTKVAAVTATALLLGGGGTAAGIALSGDDRVAAPPTTDPEPAPTSITATSVPFSATTTEPPAPQATSTTAPTTTPTTEPTTTATTAPITTADPTTTEPPPDPDLEDAPATEPEPRGEAAQPEPPPPDRTAPTVTITSAPSGTVAVATATVAFAASENRVTFACRLDAAAFAPCASPVELANLAAGAHEFSVRAKDRAGNVGQAASVAWTYEPPDTTPPTVTITTGPPASTTDRNTAFSFVSSKPGSTFACSLDGGAFAACTSPISYARLTVGAHAFSVQATDPAGNTGPPATHSWTIVVPRPDLYVSAFSRFSITISNKGTASAGPSTLTISSIGTFKVPGIPAGGSATFSWSICRVAVYTAVVDREQAVIESDETNNIAALRNTCS